MKHLLLHLAVLLMATSAAAATPQPLNEMEVKVRQKDLLPAGISENQEISRVVTLEVNIKNTSLKTAPVQRIDYSIIREIKTNGRSDFSIISGQASIQPLSRLQEAALELGLVRLVASRNSTNVYNDLKLHYKIIGRDGDKTTFDVTSNPQFDVMAALAHKSDDLKINPNSIVKPEEGQNTATSSVPTDKPSGVSSKTEANELHDKLADTFWTYYWDDRMADSKKWVCLNADGTATAGWHKSGRMGTWKVVGKMAVELSVSSGSMNGTHPGETLTFNPSFTVAGKHSRISQPTAQMLDKAEIRPASTIPAKEVSPSQNQR